MKKTTVTPASTKVAQWPAGMEVKAIRDGNDLYLLTETLGDDAGGGKPSKTEDDDVEETAPVKKGRGAKKEEAPAEKPAPSGDAKKAEKAVAKIFDQLADGELDDEDSAVDAILEATGAEASSKKGIRKIVDKFMADNELLAADMAAEVTALLSGDDGEEEKPKGRRGAAAKEEKPKLKKVTDVSTLEVGDVVDVLLSTDEDPDGEWYTDAKVTKVKRGGIPVFTFTDGDVLDYDEETMLEIKLHA